ncbi:hypothetical protein RvY_08180 [Ramazzottius varieornatus]|uniref:Uncharacterized protein n=1 Tax=Ramazzottius varieornatus TaxID=947166 RepID=A0A1D1V4X2_RAMVA|nr:hypothetical protein RvY_08180 [Ramazzottius varieornatus]
MFLENPTERVAIFCLNDSLSPQTLTHVWSKHFLWLLDIIKHFVLVGKISSFSFFRNSDSWSKKLMYARNYFDSDDDWSDIAGSSLTSVSIFQCSLKFYGIYAGVLIHQCAFWQAYLQQNRRSARLAPSYTSVHYYLDWDLTINLPSLTVQEGECRR